MSATTQERVAPHDAVGAEHYEQLRRYVFGEALEPGAKPTGLALLRRAGLRAWFEAMAQASSPAPPFAEAESGPPGDGAATDEVDIELARVLTAMVLGRLQREQQHES